MSPATTRKPRQILLSKRANLFYLEHARVLQKDERIIWLTDNGEDICPYFNLPERNTALVLLGKGTSITDSAMRRLAESNVMVGFCGSSGSPLFAATEPVFLTPTSEYRPTEYMQAWAQAWFHEPSRLKLAKALLMERSHRTDLAWTKNPGLVERSLPLPPGARDRFSARIQHAPDTTALLLAEAEWAKALYATLAQGYNVEFSRQEGEGKRSSKAERINSLLDHGNYLAYGLAAVTLQGLGISYAFPLLHGKTRRGALVFDVADLIKDAYVLPLAFEWGADPRAQEKAFRAHLMDTLHEADALDFLFDFIKKLCELSDKKQ